jgi:hypothetical protein
MQGKWYQEGKPKKQKPEAKKVPKTILHPFSIPLRSKSSISHEIGIPTKNHHEIQNFH